MKTGGATTVHDVQSKGIAAKLLSDWWSRPTMDRVIVWNRSTYRENVSMVWNSPEMPAWEKVDKLLEAARLAQDRWVGEYERLFVGPAQVPCPPYEAVWRTDRPKHEQGTVTGQSTDQIKSLYRMLRLKPRPGEVELTDHIAVELEVLAYSWNSGASQKLTQALLKEHLLVWLPAFCAAVGKNSETEYYRILAGLTLDCIKFWADLF